MANDRSVKVRIKGDISDLNRAFLAGAAGAKAFARDLDTSSDRMSNLVQTSLALAPALVPIGAAIVPALSGLTSALALSAGAAGVAVLAFQGIGDALKATNDYAIEPSAANFDKMQQSLSELGPAGRDFVGFLQEIRPELQGLQDAAQAGLLPGAEQGIRELMEVMPQAERVIGTFGTTIGTLLAEAGDNLNDPRWVEFFDYVEGEAKTTLLDFGRSIGNLTEGFANLWMAFDPLSDNFSDAFLNMSRDFAAWSDGLAETQGFQEFVDYIQENGPKAWDTLGSLGTAFVELIEAAAPVGAAVLPVIEALADTIATIADSDVGPVLIGTAAGISAISRAVALYNAAQGGAFATLLGKSTLNGAVRAARDLPAASRAYMDFGAALGTAGPKVGAFASTSQRLGAALAGNGKLLAGGAGLAFVMSDLDEKVGLSNTALGTLAGTMFGPWGAAIGGGVGLAKDFAAANDDVWTALDAANEALKQGPENLKAQADAVDVAREKVEELRKAVEPENGSFGNPFAQLKDDFIGIKNTFEGVFGRSDIEEATSALLIQGVQLGQNARAAQDLRFEQAGLGSSMDGASASIRAQADAILDNIAKHNALNDVLLENRGTMRDFEAAIDDASAAVEENGQTLDINTEAGRDNQAKLDGIASAYNNLDEASKANEGNQKKAREALIKTAQRMGETEGEARLLAASVLNIPAARTTKANLQDNASYKIGQVAGRLADLNGRTATTYIDTIRRESVGGGLGAAAARAIKRADGGILRGPGTGTSDDIPLWGSNGEYVVKAKSVEQYGVAFFDMLNAGKFADGGLLGASRVPAQMGGTGTMTTLAASGMSVSLVGTKVAIDPRTNIGTFVRGEVQLAIGEQARLASEAYRQANGSSRYAGR